MTFTQLSCRAFARARAVWFIALVVTSALAPPPSRGQAGGGDAMEEAPSRSDRLAQAERAAFVNWAAEITNINRELLRVIRDAEGILDIAARAASGQASRQLASTTKDTLAGNARVRLKQLRAFLDRRFPNPRFANPSYVEQVREAHEFLLTTTNKMNAVITETENTFYSALNRGEDIDIDAQPATLLALATEFEVQTFELRRLSALRDTDSVEGHVFRAQIEANQAVATALTAIAENARAVAMGRDPGVGGLIDAGEHVLEAEEELALGQVTLGEAMQAIETGPREKTQIRRLRTRLIHNYTDSLDLSEEAIDLAADFIERIDGMGIPLADDPFFGRMREIAQRQRTLSGERNRLQNDLIRARLPPKRPPPRWKLPDGTVLEPS